MNTQSTTAQSPCKTPWCLAFQRKDLLTASWGSKKGADLLYHFLHRASWEKENKHKNETLKDIKFQESTPKALEKSGLSLGSFHTYLKLFVSVGYLSTEAYSGEYTLHVEAIQQAFSQAPEKPGSDTCKRSYTPRDSFNLKDCNFVTLPREDYEMLMELKDECFKLKEMFQSLKHDHAQMLEELKQIFQSLKQNATIYANGQANAEAFSDPKSNDLRDSLEDDSERESKESADAQPTLENTPYQPDPSQLREQIQELSPVLDEKIEQVDEQREAIRGESESRSQLSTLTGAFPQANAHIEPQVEQEALIERPAVPEMPPEAAKWCAETLVQIVEFKIKKYYRITTRTKQINAAQRILKDDPELTRAQFVLAYDERDDDWWHDHKGPLHVNHMAEKDRVHEMLDRIEDRNARATNKSSSRQNQGKSYVPPQPKDTGMVLWHDSAGVERLMTYAEADENGWNGGFGEYIQHTHYGRTVLA